MRKSLRRALERLREKTGAVVRGRTAARRGLEEPQRLQPAPVPVHTRR